MQPRVPQTGGFPFSLIVFSLIIAFLYFYRVVFFPSAMPLLSSFFFFFLSSAMPLRRKMRLKELLRPTVEEFFQNGGREFCYFRTIFVFCLF
jgi:hypothetical protein